VVRRERGLTAVQAPQATRGFRYGYVDSRSAYAGEEQIQDRSFMIREEVRRGHIVRRDDTAWGDTAEEEILANSDSFHFTNSTPQHEQFNRAEFGFHGLWGELENQIKSQASNVGTR